MLVLTRRLEESIVIAGNIIVTVLSVEGEKVKLGIEAPRDVPILRRELYNANFTGHNNQTFSCYQPATGS